MKRLLALTFLASALLISTPTVASDGGTDTVYLTQMGLVRGINTEGLPEVQLDGDPELVTVIAEASEVITSATNLKTGKFLAIAAFLAALFKLLLSVLRLTSDFFKNKAVPKITAIVLGILVGLFASLAGGAGWVDTLILVASGPGAIAIHEISKLLPAVRAIKDSEEKSSHSE